MFVLREKEMNFPLPKISNPIPNRDWEKADLEWKDSQDRSWMGTRVPCVFQMEEFGYRISRCPACERSRLNHFSILRWAIIPT